MMNWQSVCSGLSKALLIKRGTARNLGRQLTRNLSGFAKTLLMTAPRRLAVPTSVLSLESELACLKSLNKNKNKQEIKRLALLNRFSNEECAELDKQNIKIVGIAWDCDHTDTTWAKN